MTNLTALDLEGEGANLPCVPLCLSDPRCPRMGGHGLDPRLAARGFASRSDRGRPTYWSTVAQLAFVLLGFCLQEEETLVRSRGCWLASCCLLCLGAGGVCWGLLHLLRPGELMGIVLYSH